MSIWKLIIIDWLFSVVVFNFNTNYEVSTPISLKTNNKTPNYVIEHLHICFFSSISNGSKRIYIYALSKLIYQVVYHGKLINTLWLCHKYG